MDGFPITTIVGLWGLVIGILFGAVTRKTEFCILGSLADISIYGDFRRLRAWMLAIAVAIVITQILHGSNLIDVQKSIYLVPTLGWSGAILGGLLFGYGTVMSRGCGGRSLIRLGGGDLRSLVSLVFLAIFAYMTMRGLTGVGREWLEGATDLHLGAYGFASQGIPEIIGTAVGLDAAMVRIVCAFLAAGGLLWFCLRDRRFRTSPSHVIAGLSVGILVSAGWVATGIAGTDEFEPSPLASMSFVRPVGDSIQYLMTFTGATLNFGIAVVAGTLVGGMAVAVMTGSFRVTGFSSSEEMLHYMGGGALMGFGGVLALGCTIGQGVTGLSTLSLGSILSVAAILAGGYMAAERLKLDPAKELMGAA